MKTRILIFALLGSALMAQNSPLADGVYAVEEGGANGRTFVIRQYEGKNVALDTANFAPFIFAGKPQIEGDGRVNWLTIQLAPEAAKRLEDLTRSHMNRRIAIVVSEKIVSALTVRSVITDGKSRVTGCKDGSCEALLRELSR